MKITLTGDAYENHRAIMMLTQGALMAAVIMVCTMVIKIPTATGGYIHPGDGFVLLSGILLGPAWGGLAAGIGSALSDLFSGYAIYAPATFIIKAVTAGICALVYRGWVRLSENKESKAAGYGVLAVAAGGILAEAFMVAGYYFFEIFMLAATAHTSLATGALSALAGVIANIIQGASGVVIASLLYASGKGFRSVTAN